MTRTYGASPLLMLTVFMSVASADEPSSPNLVENGDFEEATSLDSWQTAGRADIQQSLSLDDGHTGRRAARLSCTHFAGGTPDAHVMMCQLGQVAIEKDRWYRLSFWVKGAELSKPVGSVAVSNTRPWGSSGVGGQFVAGTQWRQVELFCRATGTVPAESSRLQFWFSGTGTMWFDDIMLQKVDLKEKFHPELSVEDVTNLLPNSSFECAGGQWASYAPNISSWAGNLNQPFGKWANSPSLGEVDNTVAWHGHRSLRIAVDKNHPPVFHWDYYDALVEPIQTVLCANQGWIPVEPGATYVLSAHLKADQASVPAQLLVRHAERGNSAHHIRVGTEWKRYEYVFQPRADFIWIAVGIDMASSPLFAGRLWLDALQLERGEAATAYAPRQTVESVLSTDAIGNIFADPSQGMALNIDLSNSGETDAVASGRIAVRDFFDQTVFSQEVAESLPAGSNHRLHLSEILPRRRGYYRVSWTPIDHSAPYGQSIRCAVIAPYTRDDSPFGMNHAYPWDFLLDLSRQAGLTWMRDWSAKWHTVEPERGRWDFSRVDPQIDRVRDRDLHCLVLLPFASAPWCSGGDRDLIRRHVGDSAYQMQRAIVACPASDPVLFRNYVAKVTERYRDRTSWIEVMNEPLYTTYAVPQVFGYSLKDYLQVLRDAHESIKATSPGTQVIGGIGTWVDSHWVKEFIEADGLQWCDAMDIHLYPLTVPPETYEDDLSSTWRIMQARGQAKPIWLTEFGCYADDDPYKTPGQIGDSAMSRANWESERAASEALVKTAAVFLSHGVAKIFYHAGTCGPINSNSGGGIFFEYGGAPRKMYVAQNVLAHQLGPHPVATPLTGLPQGLRAYCFQTGGASTQTGDAYTALVWASDEPMVVELGASVRCFDLMGNALSSSPRTVDSTPIYLHCVQFEELLRSLAAAKSED